MKSVSVPIRLGFVQQASMSFPVVSIVHLVTTSADVREEVRLAHQS